MTATAKTAIEEIAKTVLGLDTLETRNSDSLDFSDQAVWDLKEALEEAYKAGLRTERVNEPKKEFLPHGAMVFYLLDKKPRWVVEWQPENGDDGSYFLVDAEGDALVAAESDLSFYPG